MLTYICFTFLLLLYNVLTCILGISKEERPRYVKILILEKLPEDNYQVLKYIVQFLSKVKHLTYHFISSKYFELFMDFYVPSKISISLYFSTQIYLSAR